MVQKENKSKKEKKKFLWFISTNPIDYSILVLVLILVGFGLVMVLSASAPSSLAETNDSYKYITRQCQAFAMGFVVMIGFSFIDYHIYKKYRWPIYAVCIGILLMVSFIGIKEGRS